MTLINRDLNDDSVRCCFLRDVNRVGSFVVAAVKERLLLLVVVVLDVDLDLLFVLFADVTAPVLVKIEQLLAKQSI